VVQRTINPRLHHLLNFTKIPHHPTLIESLTAQFDLHSAVVSVEESAFPPIVQESMTVAEVDHFGDSIHVQWSDKRQVIAEIHDEPWLVTGDLEHVAK